MCRCHRVRFTWDCPICGRVVQQYVEYLGCFAAKIRRRVCDGCQSEDDVQHTPESRGRCQRNTRDRMNDTLNWQEPGHFVPAAQGHLPDFGRATAQAETLHDLLRYLQTQVHPEAGDTNPPAIPALQQHGWRQAAVGNQQPDHHPMDTRSQNELFQARQVSGDNQDRLLALRMAREEVGSSDEDEATRYQDLILQALRSHRRPSPVQQEGGMEQRAAEFLIEHLLAAIVSALEQDAPSRCRRARGPLGIVRERTDQGVDLSNLPGLPMDVRVRRDGSGRLVFYRRVRSRM